MRSLILGVLVWLATSSQAIGQTWRPPADSERCPSAWGAADERGAANLQGPESVLRAARLIRTGEVVEMGRVLSSDMPMSATRQFDLHTKRTTMNPQSNRRGSNEELVIAEIGQVGTQFDGFAHQTIGDSMYNCFKVTEAATRTGFTRLGIHNVGAIVARGVLIDVAGLKNVPRLSASYEITEQDLQQALSRQDVTLQRGDAVLIHTGWGTLWGPENATYQASNPGIGVRAAEWLARQSPVLVGADTATVEVNPNPDRELSLPAHQIMLVVNGVHLLENLKLDELAVKRAYEFAFVVQPLKIQGATGSTVAPIAIR
ncbi:MAG: cyclase family protein [Acidobacteriota bacterium]